MAARITACLVGTWTDWKVSLVIEEPAYDITIRPLDKALFGVHITSLTNLNAHPIQLVLRARDDGVEVDGGEDGWQDLTARLE